jgi:small neutral amino acid transporter SnatA (MarC family)
MRKEYKEGAGMKRLRFSGGILLFITAGINWGCATTPSCPPPSEPITTAPSQVPSALIQPLAAPLAAADPVLLQKVHAQEERIKELTTQLRLLKSIDFEGRKDRAVKSCRDHPC